MTSASFLSKGFLIRKFIHEARKVDFNSFICFGEYKECYSGNRILLYCKKLNKHGSKRLELRVISYKGD